MSGSRFERLAGVDAVRGAAIGFVVAIHAASPLAVGAYREHVEGGIARLGVPLFLLISGVLAAIRQTTRDRFRGYLTKFVRLHLLYGALHIPYALLKYGVPVGLSPKWLLLRFGETSWPGQYYFLILIQIFALAAWVPPQSWRRGVVLTVCAALVPLGLVARHWFAANVDPHAGLRASFLLSMAPIWYWVYYFALGGWIGDRMRRGAAWQPSRPVVLLLLAAAAAIGAFGLPVLGDHGNPPGFGYFRPRIYVATTLVALALPSLARIDLLAWLQRMGRESFGLFVLNPTLLLLLFTLVGEPKTGAASLAYAVTVLVVGLPLARRLRERVPWAYA